jgi:hypothetical protein
MEHALRSNGLLRVKASQTRISQSDLKTGGGVVRMVQVSSSQRLRQCQVKDGCDDMMGYVGPCYSCLAIFFVLCSRGILVFLSFL